jgi:uncharacterized membrane protein
VKQKYKTFLYLIIGSLAAAIRLWDINARSLWFDEAIEYWTAKASLLTIPKGLIASSFQPPLYSFILHFWQIINNDPVWLRMLSVIVSLLTVIGTMALANKIGGFWGGIVAGLVMAFLPTEVKYAQEVAEYALMECLLIWMLYWLYESMERPGLKSVIIWGILCTLCIYCHYGTAIIVLASALAALIEDGFRRRWRSVILRICVLACCLALLSPLFIYFLPIQLGNQSPVSVIATQNFKAEIINIITVLGEPFIFAISGYPFSHIPRSITLIPVLILLFISFTIVRKKKIQSSRILAWFWVSVAIEYIFIRFGLYAYGGYGFRYGLILIPLFVVVSAIAFVNLSDAWKLPNYRQKAGVYFLSALCGLAIMAMLCLSVYSLPNRSLSQRINPGAAWPETEDMREVVAYWNSSRAPSDLTYVYYGAVPAFGYYRASAGSTDTDSVPDFWYVACWNGDDVDACSSDDVIMGQWIRSLTPEGKRVSIMESLGHNPERFWMVFSHVYSDEDDLILDDLSPEYHVANKKQFRGASVFLLVKTQ